MALMLKATNLEAQFAEVNDYWSPKVLGKVNDQYIKVAKLKGELTWHHHEDEDELFYIVKGQMTIQFDHGQVELSEGDFYVVSKGQRHNPIAKEECWIMLIETVTTKHTGNIQTPKTKTIEQQLQRS